MARRLPTDERGTGVISTWIGFVVFIGMLLFTVQSLLNLYATSVVTAAAYDAARLVAEADGGSGSIPAAEDHARRLLGRFGSAVAFDWSASSTDDVVLRVQASGPGLFGSGGGGSQLPFGQIDRTVRLRVERFR